MNEAFELQPLTGGASSWPELEADEQPLDRAASSPSPAGDMQSGSATLAHEAEVATSPGSRANSPLHGLPARTSADHQLRPRAPDADLEAARSPTAAQLIRGEPRSSLGAAWHSPQMMETVNHVILFGGAATLALIGKQFMARLGNVDDDWAVDLLTNIAEAAVTTAAAHRAKAANTHRASYVRERHLAEPVADSLNLRLQKLCERGEAALSYLRGEYARPGSPLPGVLARIDVSANVAHGCAWELAVDPGANQAFDLSTAITPASQTPQDLVETMARNGELDDGQRRDLLNQLDLHADTARVRLAWMDSGAGRFWMERVTEAHPEVPIALSASEKIVEIAIRRSGVQDPLPLQRALRATAQGLDAEAAASLLASVSLPSDVES